MKKLLTRKNVTTSIVAMLLFSLTFFGDRTAFVEVSSASQFIYYGVVKISVLVFLWCGLWSLQKLVAQCRRKQVTAIIFIKFFALYVTVFLFFLVLLFPGVIGVDETNVLDAARHLDIEASWHHVLTVFWYAFSIGIFPSPVTPILLEVGIISGIAAFIASRIYLRYGKRLGWLSFAVFILPPVIMYSLTPHRIVLFGFFELLMIFLTLYLPVVKKRFTTISAIFFGVLIGIVASWRPEAMVYLVIIPVVLFFFLFRKYRLLQKDQLLYCCLAIICVFGGVTFLQNLNKEDTRQYQVTGLFAPLSYILKDGQYNTDSKAKVEESVDAAISYRGLVDGENPNALYWSRDDRSISDEDLDELKSTTIDLIVANPVKYAKGAIKNYLISSGIIVSSTASSPSPSLDLRFAEGLHLNAPINSSLRDQILVLLVSISVSYEVVRWYFITSMLALLLLVFLTIRLKSWLLAIMLAGVVMKTGVVIVSSPMPSALYYFPFFLVIVNLAVLAVCFYADAKRRRRAD